MRLHENSDFTTLTWVKPELDQTLQQARNALLTYVEEGEDPGQLRACASCLHQVQGTLRMVELYGAAMVADEMEQLTRALSENRIDDRDAAYGVLMQAIVQLPDYLERLQSGYRDIPIVLLPLLNGLRAARGEKDLSEAVLFSPDLTLALPPSARGPEQPLPQAELKSKAEALSAQFQTALLHWLKDDHSPEALSSLTRVCDQLVPITDAESARRLFWIAGGTLDALSRGSFEAAKPLKQSLAKVEREIKRLAAQGDAAFRTDPPIELTKQLLYFVAHAPNSDGRIGEIRETFGLDSATPNEAELAHARSSLTGHNRALLSTVAGAIKEDLLRVKDALDLHLRTPGASTAELGAQVEALDRVADTLGMLGLNVPRRVVEEQRAAIQDVVSGNRQANEATLLDIAGALLYVEASLDDQVERLGHGGDDTAQPGSLPGAESRKVLEVLIKEAIGNFAQARQCYVAFVETHWDHAQLADVPRLLDEVSGALRILDIGRPPQYLTAIRLFTERELLRRHRVPNGQQMDRLADSLASLEYYLEAFRDRRPNRDHILDVAEESLKALGYWPLRDEDIEDEAPAPVAAAPAPAAPAPAAPEPVASVPEVVAIVDPVEIAATPAVEAPVEPVAPAPEPVPVELVEAVAVIAPEPTPVVEPELTPVAVAVVAAVPVVAAIAPVVAAAPAGVLISGYEMGNDEIDDEIREVFLEEFEEEIGNLQQLLPAWRLAPDKPDLLRPIRRVFHTLKGSGRLVGAKALGEFSWKIESLLNRVLDGSRPASPAVIAMIDLAHETLPSLRAALQGEVVYGDLAGMEAVAERVAAGEEARYQAAPAVAMVAEAIVEAVPEPEAIVFEPAPISEPVAAVVPEPVVEEPVLEGIEFSIDPVLFEILKPEVHGHLEVVDAWLAQCSIRGPQPVNDPLLRSIHTMNGAFAMTEVSTITEVTAPLESYMKRSLAHQVVPNSHGIEAVADAARAIRHTIAALDKPRPVLPSFAALAARVVSLRDFLPEALVPSVPMHVDAEEETVESVMPQVAVMEAPDVSAIPDFAVAADTVEMPAFVPVAPAAVEEAVVEAIEEPAETVAAASGESEPMAPEDAVLEAETAAVADEAIEFTPEGEAATDIELVEETAVEMAEVLPEEFETLAFEEPVIEQAAVEEISIELEEPVEEAIQVEASVAEEFAVQEPVVQEPVVEEFAVEEAVDGTAAEAMALEPAEYEASETGQAIAIEDFEAEFAAAAEPVAGEAIEPEAAEATLAEESEITEESQAAASSQESPVDEEAISLADFELAELLPETVEEATTLDEAAALPLEEEIVAEAVAEESGMGEAVEAETAAEDEQPAVPSMAAEDSDSALAAMIAAYAAETPAAPADEALAEEAPEEEQLVASFESAEETETVETEVVETEVVETEAEAVETEAEAEDATGMPDIVGFETMENFEAESLAEAPASFPVEAPTEAVSGTDDFYGLSEEELERLTSPEVAEPALAAVEIEAAAETAEDAASEPTEAAETAVEPSTEEAEELEEAEEIELVAAADDIEADAVPADEPVQAEEEELVFEDEAETPTAPVAETAEAAYEPASVESLMVPLAQDPADPDAELDMTDLDSELLDIFMEESTDILDHSDGLMAKLRREPGNQELVIGLQRDLHTLKGGARMSGIYNVGELGHAMESLLESAAEGRHPLTSVGVTVLERAFDRLHGMVGRVGERKATSLPANLIAQIDALSRGETLAPVEVKAEAVPEAATPASTQPAPESTTEAGDVPAKAEAPPEARPAPLSAAPAGLKPLSAPVEGLAEDEELASVRAPQEQVRIRADLLDQLVTYAGEVAIYRARLEQQLGAFRTNLGELDQTTTRLREQLRRLDIETEAQISARYVREGEDKDSDFDPLELDRFTTQQQLSRSLSESANDLVNLKGSLEDLTRQYETLLLQQSRVSSDLQEGLMRTRMVPFDALVPRLRRVLRQASMDSGKQVQLKVDGASGEMDRNVLDRMTAPLEHMLRNSVAHGLELPADRRKLGKPEEGTVRIAVLREGSEVVLKVSDDGKGLNKDAIRRKAIERGLRREDEVMSDEELYGLILETGFSTAETVSRLSGRGVGMDVVYSEIRQLGGSLQIRSNEGSGSEFIVRLPFTLAVTKAVFVKIGDTNFAVPIASVQGVGRISRAELDKQLASENPKFTYAGEDYAIHDLGHLIGHAPAKAAESLQMPLLLARSGDLRAAISIDQVLGSREIVVKPVGPQVNSVPGIFGATIMGDGRVVVILDVAPLVRRQAAISREARLAPQVQAPIVRRVPAVMVVDDSITMRKVTGRVLERHNFEVLTAKDGVDAVEKMAERVPDLVLLDIEMPRMDGYEVAQNMRNDPRLREVPIIMITSRTGDKHRQRAMEIGVNRYLGKPYQEPELMRNVFEMLGMESTVNG